VLSCDTLGGDDEWQRRDLREKVKVIEPDDSLGTDATSSAHDTHADLLRRHKASLFPSVALFYDEPIELRRGERQYVFDADGRQYLDFFGGIATVSSGHAIPEINEPVKTQLDQINHSSTLFLIRSQIELAERIRAMTPDSLDKVLFVNSGTEANEAAFLVTTLHRNSNELIALRHSYQVAPSRRSTPAGRRPGAPRRSPRSMSSTPITRIATAVRGA